MYPKSEYCETLDDAGRAVTGRRHVACAFSALALTVAFGLSTVLPPDDGRSITAAMAVAPMDAADYAPAPAQRGTP